MASAANDSGPFTSFLGAAWDRVGLSGNLRSPFDAVIYFDDVRNRTFWFRTIRCEGLREARHLSPPLSMKALFPSKSRSDPSEIWNASASRLIVGRLIQLLPRSITLIRSSDRPILSARSF